MTARRVLFIDLAPAAGGSVVSLYHLASHLDTAQYEPAIVLSRQNPFDRFATAGIPSVRVQTPQWQQQQPGAVSTMRAGRLGEAMRRGRLAGPWHFAGDLRRYRNDVLPLVGPIAAAIERFRPAIVHLNDNVSLSRPGVRAAWRTGRPAICHCRSFDPPVTLDRWLLAPRLAGLIFISQAVAQQQTAALRTHIDSRVIANAVDLAEFDVPSDASALRAELGVPLDAPLIGSLGRITAWKGQHIFIDALARVSQQHPGVHGVVVGAPDQSDGTAYAESLRRQAQKNGLAERLHFTGPRRDVPQILASLDILVHSAVRPEPFGRVIIEGMAARRPVVASASGGATEIITNGETGLLTPPGDAAALATALDRLLRDPAGRGQLAAAGRRLVENRYQIGTQVAAVQDFYDEILAGQF
ncbi:MAG: glycosyltransferase family 4 protein [Caldilineae bacterium]|nr:glycosyltransferase family 4 protein [Anaerolineae bacterium]MCB9154025.1 glycosyltransferase family 4 protein [Caldilineae bacterium]